jgi:DNA-binding response OmpR family regulator
MRGVRVLVVDDDEEMRRWLRLSLARLGAVVVEAAGGQECLRHLGDDGRFDLVITDERMPAPGGLEVAALARARGIRAPFLIVTAFSDEELRDRAAQLDATTVLDKPFEIEELLARARALVGRASAR